MAEPTPTWTWGRVIWRIALVVVIAVVIPKLIRNSTGSPEIERLGADLDREQGRHDAAIAKYTALIGSSPDARSYAGRGDSYRAKRDYIHAFADFDAALARDPRNFEALLYRCRANRETGATDRAISDCRQAAAVGNGAEPHTLLGRMLLARGEVADARAQFDVAVARQGKDFTGDDGRIYRGQLALFYDNRPTDAADDFSRALEHLLGRADVARLLGEEESYVSAVSYLVVWRHIARVRAHADDAQDLAARLDALVAPVRRQWRIQHLTDPDPSEAKVLALALKEWPAPFIALYVGKLAPADIRAAANADADPAARRQRACDADLYLGLHAAQQGSRDEVARLLQAAAGSCAGMPEAGFAKAELARMR
jgi:tetratricopeptide (TPR) repeat protein